MTTPERYSDSDAAPHPSYGDAYRFVEVPFIAPASSPEDPRLHHDIDQYFDALLSSLGLTHLMRESFVDRQVAFIAAPNERQGSYEERHSLLIHQLQVLGVVVTKVRGDAVYSVEAEKIDLEPETLEAIQAWHEGDAAITDILFRA